LDAAGIFLATQEFRVACHFARPWAGVGVSLRSSQLAAEKGKVAASNQIKTIKVVFGSGAKFQEAEKK
jgi:hypothetical protein